MTVLNHAALNVQDQVSLWAHTLKFLGNIPLTGIVDTQSNAVSDSLRKYPAVWPSS